MNSYKIFKYFAIVIGAISLYFAMRVFLAGDDTIMASSDLQSSVVSPFLYIGYIVFFLTILLVLFFTIQTLVTSSTKKTFITLGAAVFIVLISYLITSGEAKTLKDGEVIAETVDHWISAGFVMLYILVFLSIIAMLMNGVNKILNR
jgi:hypothetical protein